MGSREVGRGMGHRGGESELSNSQRGQAGRCVSVVVRAWRRSGLGRGFALVLVLAPEALKETRNRLVVLWVVLGGGVDLTRGLVRW